MSSLNDIIYYITIFKIDKDFLYFTEDDQNGNTRNAEKASYEDGNDIDRYIDPKMDTDEVNDIHQY